MECRSRAAVRSRPWLLCTMLATMMGVSALGCNAVTGLLSRIPGAGLLGGLGGLGGGLLGGGGGPAGFVLSLLLGSIEPPPNPLENASDAPFSPSADGKFIVEAPSPLPIAPRLMADLDVGPAESAVGPDGMIYFTEEDTGRVRVFDPINEKLLDKIVLDLPVNASGQRGLIGIAFSPTGDRMYLTYVRSNTDADTSEINAAADARVVYYPFADGAVTGAEMVLYTTPAADPAFPSDINGIGPCLIAPDGLLYWAHGDRNSILSTLNLSPGEPAGKVHRMTLDGGVAPGNPFPDNSLFAIGFRNVTSMAVDPETGLFWSTDVNVGVSDELNLHAPGLFHGWPLIQGLANTDFESRAAIATLAVYRNPLIDFGATKYDPRGLAVIRGDTYYGPDLEGDVLVGQSSVVPSVIHRYRVTADVNIIHSLFATLPSDAGRIVSMVRADPLNRIYTFTQHRIFRLDPG